MEKLNLELTGEKVIKMYQNLDHKKFVESINVVFSKLKNNDEKPIVSLLMFYQTVFYLGLNSELEEEIKEWIILSCYNRIVNSLNEREMEQFSNYIKTLVPNLFLENFSEIVNRGLQTWSTILKRFESNINLH